jgi:hypothetical protein
MPPSKIILKPTQPSRQNYTDNLWNALQTICRKQQGEEQSLARQLNQYYRHQEQTIDDDNDDDEEDDVFDLIDY